ncbi:hypothetical protein [Wolbachia endosymbiont (group A) of Conops quadrifasciatus]|uniref:hypothetical protein n=1 Tax=Wolbachia endosymbiont (group A) of Conops quadrifasciatus TaxID=3066143 RepID=UPI0031334299
MNKEDLIPLGVLSVIGALTGLGLSFTALSPLVIGGIIAAIPAILVSAYDICTGEYSKKDLFAIAVLCVASAAIGVGLAAAETAIFPGAMLGLGSAALAGATIGVIALIAGVFVTVKVSDYIISPIIEHFSSKGEGYESL